MLLPRKFCIVQGGLGEGFRDSDVPLVRGSKFAVLTESDDLSDIEPLMCPAGQTRDEDDINTVPASSGAVAAHGSSCHS